MAFYSGQVKINQLFDALVTHLKANPGSPWVVHHEIAGSEISLKSLGSSGTDSLFVKLKKDTSKDATGNTIALATASNISNVDGSLPAGAVSDLRLIYLHSVPVNTNLLVKYELSILADRIILYTEGDYASATGASVLAYAGLIKRYYNLDTSDALGIGVTYQGDDGIKLLKDKAGAWKNTSIYDAFTVMLPANPGWGNLYHASPIIMANLTEGARGELIDVLSIAYSGINAGDEVTVGGKVYKVYRFTVNGNSFLPGAIAAVFMG